MKGFAVTEDGNAPEWECNHCKRTITKPDQIPSTMLVTLSSPCMADDSPPFLLCGLCAMELSVWLHPELAADPIYQQSKAHITQLWE
jgi:hypothetical protein